MTTRRITLILGPALFALISLLPAPAGMSGGAQMTLAVAAWMASWWIAEPLPAAVTALLPLALFPLCGVLPVKNVSSEYGGDIIYLFLAGFIFGKAIERLHLHRRIALQIVLWLGTDPARIVLGFMVASAFISMWISNTATCVMMTPVALALLIGQRPAGPPTQGDNDHLGKCLMLGVSYACSIGGLGTLVGTPTNGIFAAFLQQKTGQTVSFGQWFLIGFPYAAILLLICWQLLIRVFPLPKAEHTSVNRESLRAEMRALGPLSKAEKRLMMLMGVVILAWVSGSLSWYKWIPYCNDTVVAVIGAILLFIIPATDEAPDKTLMDWATAVQIPWGIIVFFGGGLALAKGFETSGLAAWSGSQLGALQGFPQWVILFVALTIVVILSELASNMATAAMILPVLAAISGVSGPTAQSLLMASGMASSLGFGLPVASAANSIVYGSGFLKARDMVKAGFILDAIAILLLTAFAYTLAPLVLSAK